MCQINQRQLSKLICEIYKTGKVPTDVKKSTVIPIPKKRDADKCSVGIVPTWHHPVFQVFLLIIYNYDNKMMVCGDK